VSPNGTITAMNRDRCINILLALCIISITIGIGEYAARLKGVPRLFLDNPVHQVLGRRLPVGSEVVRPCDDLCISQKHNTEIAFNNIGVRDVDHKQQKPDGVKRIVILGDSMTAGRRVQI